MNIRIVLILAFLAHAACITTVEAPAFGGVGTPTRSAKTPTPQVEEYSGAIYEIPTLQAHKCATVTANIALHLRAEPTEKSRALAYLYNGEQVEVLAKEPKWWTVRSSDTIGWAKAEYLEESECR